MAYEYDRRQVTASGDSLSEAKLAWTKRLAEAMASRFESAGGWRAHRIESTISIHGPMVNYQGTSTVHGFEMHASIITVGQVSMHLQFIEKTMDPTNIDLVEMHRHLENSVATIKVADNSPMEKVVMDASLFFSKFVNKIPQV